MAGSIAPSFSFQQAGSYSAAQVNSWLTGASISGIDRTNFASATRPVTVDSSEPSTPQTGELWYDTSTTYLKLYDGTDWHILGPIKAQIYTARSTIAAGDVVVLDLDNASSVETTTTVSHPGAIGVALTSAASTEDVWVQTTEVGTVNCTTTAVAIGDILGTSATAGQAATVSGGGFGVAVTSKGSGAGTVLVLLQRMPVLSYVTASYATYTASAALTTTGGLSGTSWYDVPDSAVGASVTSNGDSAMDVTFTTTKPNQVVMFNVRNMEFGTGNIAHEILGVRIVLGASTVLAGWTSKGSEWIPNAVGEEEKIGPASLWSDDSPSTFGISLLDLTIMVVIPTAGSNTLRLQFSVGTNNTYVLTNTKTATLSVAVM